MQASRDRKQEGTMKGFAKILGAALLALTFAGAASADTLELKDGRVLQGRYLGGTQAVLRFEVDSSAETTRGGSAERGRDHRGRHSAAGAHD
jgi:hypothetical protein